MSVRMEFRSEKYDIEMVELGDLDAALRSKVGIPSGWWISDRPRLATRFEAREPVPIPTLRPWARVSPDPWHLSVVTRLVCVR